MGGILDLLGRVWSDVLFTSARVWPFLLVSVVAAAAVSVYVGLGRVSGLLRRRAWVAVGGAVLLATLTPFCSCGTTAVVLGMLATSAPWAPLVAFMVASPLTSPSELVFSAGLFGWPFALVFFVGTIGIGVVAGAVAGRLDAIGWLRDQTRVQPAGRSCREGACEVAQPVAASVGPGTASVAEYRRLYVRLRLPEFGREIVGVGRKLVLFFVGFTALGYLAIEAIPTAWVTGALGGDSPWAVPLAAVLGIPAYLNTEASLPLVAALMDGGMGPGPALAFLVTGAGTSVGAISGLFVIARSRVVSLVVALLFAGSLVLGWIGQMVL